jgi:cell division protein FtsN
MTQDFANKKKPSKKAKSSPKSAPKTAPKRKSNSRTAKKTHKKAPLWAWLFIGVCLMGFAFFLNKISSTTAIESRAHTPTSDKKIAPKAPEESQVRFDFYQILKGQEVEVDDRVIENTPKESNIIYWLQIASFKNASDADQMRAKLLLINLNASTEKTTNKNAQEWHRVMAGPFKSRSKLAKARSILASNQINAIVIKRKAEP